MQNHGGKFYPYWRICIGYLQEKYDHQCAYTGLYIHPMTGAGTVDHILPKKSYPKLAYEWSNYCYACSRINSKKGEQTGIISPFQVQNGLFRLILETGKITVNRDSPDYQLAADTIENLDLNNQNWKDIRKKYYAVYVKNREAGMDKARAEQLLKKSFRVYLD